MNTRLVPTRIQNIILSFLATSALHADTTLIFQNGANSYSGAKDVSISTQYGQYNNGNGTTSKGVSELGCYTTTGSDSYASRYLLKFTNLAIPGGSSVTSATLTLSIDSWESSSGNITGFYLLNSWNPASNNLGWIHRDNTLDWALPGASAPGADTVAGKSFQVPPLHAIGVQTASIPLDRAVVQSWIDNPALNQGILLVNNNPGEIMRIVSTAGTPNIRPKLTVVIGGGVPAVSVSLSPSTATLQPGQTRQFTATVSGTSNTAVTWSATGGTISTSGLYTAGSASGTSFTVKATSLADSAKSASATVTIQSAPAISVTISPTSASLQPGQTQQFTATVSGTSNTAVTWSAAGGTISTSGLYTAGSTTGTSFTVKATSVADTTKSATATITIQSPPSISVTLSPTSATLQPGQTQQFTATVSGTSNTGVTWSATGGTISTNGLYTAGSTTGTAFTVKATSVADATKSATATVTIATPTNLPPIPRQTDGAYVVVQSPSSGMHFTAPATIRIYADPFDINAPDPDALTVTFLMNGQPVGTYTGNGAQNGYWALTVNNVAAGTYAISARITTTTNTIVNSPPVTVYVDNPITTSGPVFNLTADVVLSGTQTSSYAGTPGNPCLINGNGFQIRSDSTFAGSLTIANCLIRGLGTATNPALNVTVNGSGSIQLTSNVFENFGTVSVAANDQAQLAVRNNEFRENTLVPVTSLPTEYANATLPVFFATGNSSAQKLFQGNNVGLSTVVFDNTRNWLIGGSTDAETNVLMGVRCGFTITRSSNMVLRGNYSQHNYPHRFSQGENFELEGDGFLAEHNVIRSSSWPVRGFGGEFRYNLIDNSGNSDQVVQAPLSNATLHHNVFIFTVSQTLYSPGSGVHVFGNVDNIQFRNNVMDGGGAFMLFYGPPVSVESGSFIGSLRNNVFYNFATQIDTPTLSGGFGESTNPPLSRLRYADYNAFYNPDAVNQNNYGLGVIGLTPGSAGYGLHDLGGFNGHMNPKFNQPTAIPFPFLAQDIWSRTKKVSEVLATYRAMYSPAAGSPLLGAGDPQDGAGGNIGAIGNGEPADQFGRFGTATPGAPMISMFTASPSTIQSGQSATLNWSVSGAATLSISPAPGTVTGTSVSVSPTVTTTYTLTASNASGSVTATTTVTVSATPVVSVSLSPTSASLNPGGTKQFTATVSNATNTSVTWSATGGTISTTGLYTAGSTSGSFTVTATSVQDPTRSASASITITAPQPVTITLAPSPVTLFPNNTQQFTATVSNATNTSVAWSATGGAISSTGLYTAGSTPGSFTITATSVQDPTRSASASVTIATATTGVHPRIILDAPTLTTLRARAQANTPEWVTLKATCDSFIGGGTVNFPGDNGYPNPPNVGEGYQGSGYVDALMPLSLCYQATRLSNPTAAAQYASKGVAILMAMSDPNHTIVGGAPVWDRDSGYGIRNFGFAMGVGYDWLHDVMTPSQLSQLQTSLNNWITGFEKDSFEYDHPQGNYFAGYYVSKCMAALAVQGDSPLGDTWWNDWYNNQHLLRVAPYYTANLAGGGWTEGFTQYGILGSRNQALPALAVKTAKGIDIIHGSQPYSFPLDQGRYLMAFTWPSRNMMDDRGELYNTDDPTIWPGTARLESYRFFAGFLALWNDPAAPMLHKYARDVKAALDVLHASDTTDWIDFLFWDNNAPEADYTTSALSYLAPGVGGVATRSDWTNSASYMTFMSSPYINNPAAGHEPFDKGSLAIEKNKNPLVVNPHAWLTHEPNGSNGWNLTYDDRFGNWDINHNLGNRILYNTFQVRHLGSQSNVLDNYGQWAMQRSDGARTQVSRFEDGGSYVLATGQFLEDMYRPFQTICAGKSPVTSWSRQIVFLRPSHFVVYDRTGICDASLDQYLAFHFPANPVEVAAPATGVRRFDVNPGQFAGSMTIVLPASAATITTDHFSTDTTTWNKMWRTEIRATGAQAATRRWMTVFDVSSTASQVAAATPLTITGGSAVGTLLASAAGNKVVVGGTAPVGTAISGAFSYTVPAAATRHVITDLTPSAGYTVSVAVSGASQTITITPGGTSTATTNGVVSFSVTAGGQVQP